MKIPLHEGAELLSAPFRIRIVEFDAEYVVLELADEIEIQLRIDDWAVGVGILVPVQGREYVFQSGGKSLEPATPVTQPARPRSSDMQRGTSQFTQPRPLSSPGSRNQDTDVYLVFRFSLVQDWSELEIDLVEDSQSAYDSRLGFRYKTSNEDSVLLETVDILAEEDTGTVLVGDNDQEESTVRIFTHTAKQYVVQGLGEENGVFHFRVGEVQFPPEDQDKPCGSCGDRTAK
jgi:hypothetical protein